MNRMSKDCGVVEVSGRRRRCESCRKAVHARVMRERRAAESGHECSDVAERAEDQVIVDYTKGPTRPPQFPGRVVPPKDAAPKTGAVFARPRAESGRAAAQAQSRRYPERHPKDRVRLDAELARRNFGAEDDASEVMSWDELQSRNARQNDSRMVSFHVPAPGSPAAGAQPERRVNAIGQSIPRSRRWG